MKNGFFFNCANIRLTFVFIHCFFFSQVDKGQKIIIFGCELNDQVFFSSFPSPKWAYCEDETKTVLDYLEASEPVETKSSIILWKVIEFYLLKY